MDKIISCVIGFLIVFSVSDVFAFSIPIVEEPSSFVVGQAGKEEAGDDEIQKARELLKKRSERPMPTDVKRGGLLLKRGQIGLDLSLAYAHFSEDKIFIEGFALLPVLIIGDIALEEIRRDLLIGSVTGKYGITDRVQVEVTVPYRYHHDRFFRPGVVIGEIEETNDDNGLGDVYATALFHIVQEGATMPHVIVGLTFKTATGQSIFDVDPDKGEVPLGTGFYALKGMVSFIKTADPAVVFLNLGYIYSFSRTDDVFVGVADPDTGEITFTLQQLKLEQGDTIEAGFGVAHALSYKLALSAQYQHSFTFKSKSNGKDIPGSRITVGYIRLGGVWALSEKTSLDLSTSFGVTADAPDTVVEFRVSYRF